MYATEKLYGKLDIPTYVEKYVNVEEFLEYGKACGDYHKIGSCPAYDFDVLDYWNRYQYIHIIGNKIIFDEEEIEKVRTAEEFNGYLEGVLKVEKQKLAEILYVAESKYPGSISLSAGNAPEKMRYSMESLGANVGMTCSKLLRVELLWSEENKLPKYFILISALLSDQEIVNF